MSGATYAELAASAGVDASRLDDVYQNGPKVNPDERIELDPGAARLFADASACGDAALALAPEVEPVLWPEHFDVGITLGEVNYGLSPGDGGITEPYAYVGPWKQHTGTFWNAPFGAAKLLADLPNAEAVAEFFRTGRRLATSAP